MPRPLVLQFGAGNIGRSLVGSVFSKAGCDILFVDALPDVVEALRTRHGYRVMIHDDLPPGAPDRMDVTNVDGVLASDQAAITDAVRRADLIATAVGARSLPAVLASIAPGIALRDKPVTILFCENLHDVVELARETLPAKLPAGFDLDARVGLAATSIGKMVPLMPAEIRQRDPLEVWGEAYNTIIADGAAFRGFKPEIDGLELHDNFAAYVDRKLYIHNLGHAVAACLGSLRGCTYIWEALDIPEIAATARAAMRESAKALMARYPGEFTREALEAHVEDLLRRFRNRALADTVYRVGRDLLRKLAPDDRFVGALRLVRSTGGDILPICRGIAAAFLFMAADEQGHRLPADVDVVALVAEEGVAPTLRDLCGLSPAEYPDVVYLVARFYRELKR